MTLDLSEITRQMNGYFLRHSELEGSGRSMIVTSPWAYATSWGGFCAKPYHGLPVEGQDLEFCVDVSRLYRWDVVGCSRIAISATMRRPSAPYSRFRVRHAAYYGNWSRWVVASLLKAAGSNAAIDPILWVDGYRRYKLADVVRESQIANDFVYWWPVVDDGG